MITQRTEGVTIRFDATLSTIDTSTVLRLPETASKNLPSRGQVAVHGTINGVEFQTVLEPDGNSGHWMRVDDTLQHAAGISAGDTAALEVADTGTGMSEEVRQRCLDPFFSTKGERGTGLGLYISQKIIEEHHGEITVQTNSGGTTFTISLPVDT